MSAFLHDFVYYQTPLQILKALVKINERGGKTISYCMFYCY